MRIYGRDKKMKTGNKKAEHMTSLSGDRLVSKTHGRIVFRGVIDTLQAELIEAQILASGLTKGADSTESDGSVVCGSAICGYLGEILDYLRSVMVAEVKETPLPPPFLFGMDAEEIHRRSHNTGARVLQFPSYTQGPLAARINTLRAKVREAELLSVRVFGPGENPRDDIILAMNRLSSALWWLFCEYASGEN